MPLELQDADGNKIVLPVDKVEDIAALKEKADKVDQLEKDVKPDWRAARATMDQNAATIADLTAKLKEKGVKVAPPGGAAPLTPAEVAAQAQEVYNQNEAGKLETNRLKMVQEMAGGDENRAKAIEAKYQELKGDKNILDPEQVASLMADAKYLIDKPRNGGGKQFNAMNGGSPGGAPRRMATGDKSKAAQNLENMGYRFKGDKEKLING